MATPVVMSATARPAMTRIRLIVSADPRLGGLLRDHRLYGAEPDDLDLNPVADVDIFRRVVSRADACRRAGEEKIARLQRKSLGEVFDLLGDAENHVARDTILPEFVIHPALQFQF